MRIFKLVQTSKSSYSTAQSNRRRPTKRHVNVIIRALKSAKRFESYRTLIVKTRDVFYSKMVATDIFNSDVKH